MSFNGDQIEYMKHLTTIPLVERCWCGWDRIGQCYNCNRVPGLSRSSRADYLEYACPECFTLGTHRIGCRQDPRNAPTPVTRGTP